MSKPATPKMSLLIDVFDSGEIQYSMSNGDGLYDSISEGAFHTFLHEHEHQATPDIRPFKAIVDEQWNAINNPQDTPKGLPTGFSDLDNTAGTMKGGELILVAARPSMGRLPFMLDIISHLAVEKKVPVGVLPVEISASRFATRFLEQFSKVDLLQSRVENEQLSKDNIKSVWTAAQKLRDAPIFMESNWQLLPEQWQTSARRLVAEHGAKILFIDNLYSLCKASGREDEMAFARALKRTAKELNVPVVCMVELEPLESGVEASKPALCDLHIGILADRVLFIHREEFYRHDDAEWREKNPHMAEAAEILVVKNDSGYIGDVALIFNGATCSFSSLPNTFG